jgi:hypothetical protein
LTDAFSRAALSLYSKDRVSTSGIVEHIEARLFSVFIDEIEQQYCEELLMDFRSVANLGLSRALHAIDTKQAMIDHLVVRFNCNAKIP